MPQPRWLKVYDAWGREQSSRRIEPNVNLYELLIVEAARYIGDGWSIDSDIQRCFGGFFLVRGSVRIHVHIMPAEHAMAPHG